MTKKSRVTAATAMDTATKANGGNEGDAGMRVMATATMVVGKRL